MQQLIKHSRTVATELLQRWRAILVAGNDNRASVLKNGVLLTLILRGVNLVLSLLTIPIALKYLGSERYGLWMLALSTFSLTSFLDLGITPALKNKMAESYAQKNNEAFKYYASCSIFLSICICLLGLVLAAISGFVNWHSVFNIGTEIPYSEVTWLVVGMVLVLMMTLGLYTIEAIYAARMEINSIRITQLITLIIGFTLFWLLISINSPLAVVAIVMPFTGAVGQVVLLVSLVRRGLVANVLRPIDVGSTFRDLMPSSLSFIGIQVSVALSVATPAFLIARFSTLSDVAIFSIAYKLASVPLFTLAEILKVFWPVFTVAWTNRELVWLRSRLRFGLVGTVGLLVPFSIILVLWGGDLILIWTDEKIEASRSLLFALSAWVIVQGGLQWLSTFLHSVSDFFFELFSFWAIAVLLVPLTIFFLKSFGLTGVGIAMVLATLIGGLLPMLRRVWVKLELGTVQ